MKKYYVQTSVNMQAKNKAWGTLQDFALEQDGTLITGDDELEKLVNQVKQKVDDVNNQFPRCTNLEFKTFKRTKHNLTVYAVVHPDEAFKIAFLPVTREIGG